MDNLILDLGNTLQKVAIYSGREQKTLFSFTGITAENVRNVLGDLTAHPHACILSSVIDYDPQIKSFLAGQMRFIELDHTTPLPIQLEYATPETLGKDRIALACAAHARFPGRNALVISAGTAITYDMVDQHGTYLGGAISPGLVTRLRALNTFTGKLPLVELTDIDKLIGKSTEESILSGVVNGTVEEINGIINRYIEQFDNLQVVITGGDHKYLAGKLKSGIFALPNLVLEGLNEILLLNAQQ